MTLAEIEHRRQQLDAEWAAVNEQLELLAEIRTIPWDESPADMETRLLLALDSLLKVVTQLVSIVERLI